VETSFQLPGTGIAPNRTSANVRKVPCPSDRREAIFVEIALGVPVFHGHLVDHVHDLSQRSRGNGYASTLHVLGVRCAITAQGSQPGEDVLADHRIHVARIGVLEATPAVVLKRSLLVVFTLGKEAFASASFPDWPSALRRLPARPAA
jgi:hypothetical protein